MDELDTLARTLYGEVEANCTPEAIAIAWVIRNRVGRASWPFTVTEVCLQPLQFSCWNANDPNRVRILRAFGAWFETCKQLASQVMSGRQPDPTNKATHYYCTSVEAPAWSKGHLPCFSVTHKNGTQHLFFNDIDTVPPLTAGQALEQVRPLAGTRTITGSRVATVATISGMVAPVIQAATPAIPLLQTIAQYAPYVFGMVTIAAIAAIIMARIDDRNKGLR